MSVTEKKAISYLPPRLADAVIRKTSLWNGAVNEIRLRENRLLSITVGRKNVSCDLICTREEIAQTVARLCGNSLYSYSEAIRDGCITTDCGIRVGVCGHAVLTDGRMTLVRDITSLNIRIPHRVPGAADKLYDLTSGNRSILVYSRPGMGKTTALRELIPLLSAGENARRVAVIDTRYELCTGDSMADMTDVLYGYPRCEGIQIAVRTLSPEYIICDEISTEQDAQALLSAHSAGIAVCASIHAGSFRELSGIPMMKLLLSAQVFDIAYGILPDGIHVQNIGNGENNDC